MKFAALPNSTRLAAGSLLGLTLFLIWDQYHWWKLQDEYAFGFIVPVFVVYVLYERWPRLGKALIVEGEKASVGDQVKSGSRSILEMGLVVLSLILMAGGLGSFFMGILYRAMEGQNLISSNFLAFGYANILLATAFLYTGKRSNGERIPLGERWQLALLFLFPALIWMLSVPMFNAVHKTVSTFLMNKVALVVYTSFDWLGYAVIREGSVLRLPLGDVGVEDACSGIRSLTACLFAGSFLGAVFFESFWKKVLLVASSMVLAFVNNILRSLFLTAWAYWKGPDGLNTHVQFLGMDFGSIHDATGWMVLGMTVLCLLALVKLLSIQFEYSITEENPT
jgi:exosortase